MVQVIAIGLVGGLVWYGYRAFKEQMASVGEELKKQDAAGKKKPAKTKTIDELEMGPDGVYRPKQPENDSEK